MESFTENDIVGAEMDIAGAEMDVTGAENSMGGAEDTIDGPENAIDGTENTMDGGNNDLGGVTDNMENQQQGHIEDVGVKSTEKKWPGWPGDSVFRILVPSHKVGGIIGRKGEFIKKMCEESKARIKILDAPPGTPERAVSCNM